MPDAAIAQDLVRERRALVSFLRISAMPLEERELRASDSTGPPTAGAAEAALTGIPSLPEDALILVPTRNLVLFPGTVLPITLGRQRSVLAAQTAMRLSRP